MNNHALTLEQIKYVISQRGIISATKLAVEFKCNRGVITGHWKRNNDGEACVAKSIENQETNDAILALYNEGAGATEIATKLGLSVTATENRLKRLRKRLGIVAVGRWRTSNRKRTPKAPKPAREKRALGADGLPLPWMPPHAPSYGPPVTFDELDDVPFGDEATCMCRHYVGNPDDSLFCGLPSVPGRPYCDSHAMVAYRSDRAPPRTQVTADRIKKEAKDFLEWRRRQGNEMLEAA